MKRRKNMSVKEAGKMGGTITKEKYGSEHFAEAGRKGAQSKLAKDPDYFKKIRAEGVRKQQEKKEEEKNPVNRFFKAISGE